MSEKTKEEIKEFMDNVKRGNGNLSKSEIEYVDKMRMENYILDSYISALEFELKELIK